MYFINNGRVHFVYGPKNFRYKSLNSGSYFGEIEIIKENTRIDSIMAFVDCDLLTLNKNMIYIVQADFP